ncbi:adenylate/guanylate cyclase domain-containing protein [Nocardia altamirensis]|uniref:adenylate/guanylate cyclase domain-containing protein n=1 Tax=Nocardia altamirensis TaxID=472158 RepID=UPI00143548AB|nr:adenylate/guanylate cyclase domain-containing protein [Nocardia altamirensis]
MARRNEVMFAKRALALLPIVGCLAGPVATLFTLLFTSMPFGTLCLVAALSVIVYGADSLLWIRATRAPLRALDIWDSARTPANAALAWPAVADLPLAPLRQRRTYIVMFALFVAWNSLGVRLLGLPPQDFLLFLPGSVLGWTYWLAIRFLLTELLIRPVLTEISAALPNGAGTPVASISLNQRLVAAVAGTILLAGTVVAGIVGPGTVTTLVIGIGASCAIAVITSWSVALLANSITSPIAQVRLAAERIGDGDLTTRVPIVSTDEVGVLARAFNTMADGLRERERIRTAFGTYLDPAVAEHILREGPSLTGAEVEVTAMFLDVRGFTGYAERHPAREVVARLNDLFELVVPIVRGHSGHVDKFVGDGLLAVFGAPVPCHDHADRALAAALDIVAAVHRTPGLEFEIAMGLNSGRVIAGNIGGAGRFDYSVIGDAINVAARVEAATRGTGDTVLLSEQTRRLLRAEHGNLIARPGIRLKGKSAPATLYAPILSTRRTERSVVDHPPHRGG